ncbi:hypothetical protein [Streptomyces lanatus]|uniref:Extradiol ring-cleavage dioxygenase class III enzyme subunit B domain-containing protein n=1 Tax=Streptomyces lanatus TaxID=66900 RepID=A0ABV1Y5G3_9ACTN|nr:hypothetical protein [Streptomyces lanatus]GHH26162.1 hypothetical protein GCM10018780_79050 [Streptomyces lanatus]
MYGSGAALDRRVLLLASGGLSHDPPVPVLDGAPPRVADALIEGCPPTPEQRARGTWSVESMAREAGRSAREVRTPIAGFAVAAARELSTPGWSR